MSDFRPLLRITDHLATGRCVLPHAWGTSLKHGKPRERTSDTGSTVETCGSARADPPIHYPLQEGDELELLSTDEGSAADIPEWINKVGHEIIDSFKEEEVLHIVVKKIK